VIFWCGTLVVAASVAPSVRITADDNGRISAVGIDVPAEESDIRLGTVVPGFGNAHSHCFHRLLRGRTHSEGGDFWRWRERMYRTATLLDPQLYFETARAVFAEMLVCGYTAVGEFHYLHHRADGSPWPQPHAMELALARAATEVGIRLTLLDTVYLAGGIGVPLQPEQRAFSDGSAAAWLDRWFSLRAALDGTGVTLGAAIHSVRAVPRDAISEILRGLPDDIPLHVHVSEQSQENADSLSAYGLTPIELLHELGVLSQRVSLVHATHLTEGDRALVAASGATVVMCPTTEADLGDGIGPARELADAGTPIALGSDQNAVIDPWLELRGLEAGERLRSGERGRFDPLELLAAATDSGYRALGLGRHTLAVGDPCDLVEVSAGSIRTLGSAASQLPLTATASDVERVIVGGRIVAEGGRLVKLDLRPEQLLTTALASIDGSAR
jgi:formiminoglutamate deiminase